mgnify:CR=1 FL=1
MAFHDVPRFTRDIDILGRPMDLDQYKRVFVGLGYTEGGSPWTFKNTNMTLHRFVKPGENEEPMIVDLLIGNEPEHEQIINDVVLDDSYVGKVRLASRQDLIKMKKRRNSDQDQVDIKILSNDEQNRESNQGSE